MTPSSRREFLQTSGILITAALAGFSFDVKKYNPLLSFSTLGCPDWNFSDILNFATQNNYSGIELRGLLHEMDLTKCKEFDTADHIAATLKLVKEKNLRFVDLGSSTNLHLPEGAEREKNLDEAKRFINLAQQLNCPYIRVFPNIFPKDQDKDTTIKLIVKGLQALGDYAKTHHVMVLMETHGDLVKTDDLEKIMQSAAHPNTGLVWDVANMWTITKEAPTEVYKRLKQYIHHTHIKDAKIDDGKVQYVLLGQGEVPIFEAIDVLAKDNYKGYYSFEWEKLWHPEIADSAMALADYPKAMKAHFK